MRTELSNNKLNVLSINKSNIYLILISIVLIFSNRIPAIINDILLHFNYEISFRPMIIIAIASFYFLPIGMMYIGLRDTAVLKAFCIVYISKGIIIPLLASIVNMDIDLIMSYILGMAWESFAFSIIGVGICIINKNMKFSILLIIIGIGLILINSPLLINYLVYAITGDISHVNSLVDSLPSNN